MEHREKVARQLFHLAWMLHANTLVCRCIVREAYDGVRHTEAQQLKRHQKQQERSSKQTSPSKGPRFYKVTLRGAAVAQMALYAASTRWERDQESAAPMRRLAYQPTVEDRFWRYMKMVVMESMSRRAVYAAMGLGGALYTYHWKEIRDLGAWEDKTSEANSQRFLTRVEDRFPGALAALYSRAAQPHERVLISAALSTFAPWVPDFAPHAVAPADKKGGLVAHYFDPSDTTEKAERLRIHALLDPHCAGLARLIRDYNDNFTPWSDMALPDPDHKLGFPLAESLPLSAQERLQPPPMTEDEWAEFLHTLQSQEERRRHFCSDGALMVYADGVERARLEATSGTQQTFCVPDLVSYVEVFGQDADGPLLLAAFLVQEPDDYEDGDELSWVIEHAGGLRCTLTVRVEAGEAGADLSHMSLTYEAPQPHEAPARVPEAPLHERLLHWLSPLWHPPLAGEPVTAAAISSQTQIFMLDAGDIQLTCAWWPGDDDTAAGLRVTWRAHLTQPGDLWVRFTSVDNASAVLAERLLGAERAGEQVWIAYDLGFDPTRVPWSLQLFLTAPSA